MNSDRLDRIDLLVFRLQQLTTSFAGDEDFVELLDLMSEELRYLHGRPISEQIIDSGQELLKEQN